jgi:hypothetical protein
MEDRRAHAKANGCFLEWQVRVERRLARLVGTAIAAGA